MALPLSGGIKIDGDPRPRSRPQASAPNPHEPQGSPPPVFRPRQCPPLAILPGQIPQRRPRIRLPGRKAPKHPSYERSPPGRPAPRWSLPPEPSPQAQLSRHPRLRETPPAATRPVPAHVPRARIGHNRCRGGLPGERRLFGLALDTGTSRRRARGRNRILPTRRNNAAQRQRRAGSSSDRRAHPLGRSRWVLICTTSSSDKLATQIPLPVMPIWLQISISRPFSIFSCLATRKYE